MFRQPDIGNFRQRIYAERNLLGDVACGYIEHVAGCQPPLGERGRGKPRKTDDISGGIDAVDLGFIIFIHLYISLFRGLNVYMLKANIRGVGLVASHKQRMFSFYHLQVAVALQFSEPHFHARADRVVFNALNLNAFFDGYRLVGKCLVQVFLDLVIQKCQMLPVLAKHGHTRTECGKSGGIFQCVYPNADDGQPFGNMSELKN